MHLCENMLSERAGRKCAFISDIQIKKNKLTLDHKTSLKSLGYICSNSQKYIVLVKIILFSFMSKIMILSKDHVS